MKRIVSALFLGSACDIVLFVCFSALCCHPCSSVLIPCGTRWGKCDVYSVHTTGVPCVHSAPSLFHGLHSLYRAAIARVLGAIRHPLARYAAHVLRSSF